MILFCPKQTQSELTCNGLMSFLCISVRYLQCNFETFDLRELECKFDVILVDPPLEEYQRRGSGISHNWRPWAWDEVWELYISLE